MIRTRGRNTVLLVAALPVFCAASCRRDLHEACEKHVRQEIPVGTPLEVAQSALKACGFQITVDRAKHTLYADKKRGGLIVERTQVSITLSSENRVKEIQVTEGLIGP